MACDFPRASERHVRTRMLAVVAALLLVAGCGTESARPGAGAAPYSAPAAPGPGNGSSASTPGLLVYPAQSLTIHYPPSFKALRKDVVLAYGAFQAALQKAVTTGRFGADLRKRTLPQARPTLRKQIATLHKLGQASSTVAITVNKLKLNGDTAGLELCTAVSSTKVPAFVLMSRSAGTHYRVLAIGPDKSRTTC